jgi:energy-coupling factor transport system substrate-specific component
VHVDDTRGPRGDVAAQPGAGSRWDRFAEELQTLRRAAGEPSFAEIARRVAAQRVADGLDEHAARVARTTVYDAFRTGRARVNVPLVREIVRALDGDPASVDAWLRDPGPAGSGPDAPAAVVPAPPAAAPAAAVVPAPPAAPARRAHVLLLLLVCVAVNLVGRELVVLLELPAHLDMVGTALAAFALGPWHGAAVGLTTNFAGSMSSGAISLPFAVVNVLGALLWGWGVRRWGLGRTLPRFLGLNLLVAVACSLVAVPILLLVLDGAAGNGQESIRQTVEAYGAELVVAVGASNLLVSLGDKLISGFVALVACSGLPASLRSGATLPLLAGASGVPGAPAAPAAPDRPDVGG